MSMSMSGLEWMGSGGILRSLFFFMRLMSSRTTEQQNPHKSTTPTRVIAVADDTDGLIMFDPAGLLRI